MNPGSEAGTYALLLELRAPIGLNVGSLGVIDFDSPYYMYCGSALGPGGLAARIRHHIRPVRNARWHIDYLRRAADVIIVWYTVDNRRLECTWATTASTFRGASPISRFGSSDCRCQSHLVGLERRPSISAFRKRLADSRPGCPTIRELPYIELQAVSAQ